MGLSEEEKAWLSNFGCNNLELFAQYNVRRLESYQQHLPETIAKLKGEIAKAEANHTSQGPVDRTVPTHNLATLKNALAQCERDALLGPGVVTKLPPEARELHERAFVTNIGDPHYHQLTELQTSEGTTLVPKGDVLHQFREDVRIGKLPTVSWLASPENFSDHPISPWYGAWYVSEVMNILTQNPEIWKKTIFILTYDENDGYFDHVPPYIAPDPRDVSTGNASPGLNYETEYVYREDELASGIPPAEARTGPVGLGFRMPMVVASQWRGRGGWVNSQLFEHTSVNQFLEHFVNTKFGCNVRENNVSSWRRAISGDLTTVFRPFFDERAHQSLPFVERDPYVETIYKAKFQPPPSDSRVLNPSEVSAARQGKLASLMGTPEAEYPSLMRAALRTVCRGNPQLYERQSDACCCGVQGWEPGVSQGLKGSPFNVYLRGFKSGGLRNLSYAVAAGESVHDSWPLDAFVDEKYHIEVHGPNGFFRAFQGTANSPISPVHCRYQMAYNEPSGNMVLHLSGSEAQPLTVEIEDCAYGAPSIRKTTHDEQTVAFDLGISGGWYDVRVSLHGLPYHVTRYAGRVSIGAGMPQDYGSALPPDRRRRHAARRLASRGTGRLRPPDLPVRRRHPPSPGRARRLVLPEREAIGESGADREDAPGPEPVVIGQKYAYGHASIVSV